MDGFDGIDWNRLMELAFFRLINFVLVSMQCLKKSIMKYNVQINGYIITPKWTRYPIKTCVLCLNYLNRVV